MNEVRNEERTEERTEEKGQEKNTKRLETIKKEDKKFYWKFIALCGIGGIIGGTAGFLMGFLDDYMAAGELSFPEIFLMVQRNLAIPFRYLTVAVGAVFWAASEYFYRKARKIRKESRDLDEDYDRIDDALNISLLLANVMAIMNFICAGIGFYCLPCAEDMVSFVITISFFLLYVYGSFHMQHVIVNMTKEMNPEKKGSLYDKKFKKQWYDSCDEAERRQIGIASYHTMQVTGISCMVFMLIFMMLGMVIEIGLLPMLVPAFIWMIQVITYHVSCKKAQKMMND